MKTPPWSLRNLSCRGVPSKAEHPSVKHRKEVNIAAGTVSNSAWSEKMVRVKTPSRYMQRSSNTTAQNSTRSPVNTPCIISFSSWKILNRSRRTIRPSRASFSIFSTPTGDPSSPPSASEKANCRVMSTSAKMTQRMSNQLQYQSAPTRYSQMPKYLHFTMISATKKTVNTISSTVHAMWFGAISALSPAIAALRMITAAGTMSKSRRNDALSPNSSSTVTTDFRWVLRCPTSPLCSSGSSGSLVPSSEF
mmetsp:Transcript_96795/g.230343  ORF Transcript_96795/g.230343 Transcript_96795/m.230343 type:complete len:250 (+) Transcript_96795:662-1411(+)